MDAVPRTSTSQPPCRFGRSRCLSPRSHIPIRRCDRLLDPGSNIPSGGNNPGVRIGGRIAGGAGAQVWVFDDGFTVLPPAPVTSPDYLGWIGSDIVVWDSGERAAAVYSAASQQWTRSDAPDKIETRVGSTICNTDAALLVWAGWIKRGARRVGSDSGAILDVRALAAE